MEQDTVSNYCSFIYVDRKGYVKIRCWDKELNKLYWMSYHRLVIEKVLEQKLSSSIEIHHRNGNKKDNRLRNLILVPRTEHKKLHGEGIKLVNLLMH